MQKQIDDKINEILIKTKNTVVSAGDDMTNEELGIIVIREYMQELISWYIEQITEKITEYADSQSDKDIAMGIIGTVSLLT
jgi:hypothetical protein